MESPLLPSTYYDNEPRTFPYYNVVEVWEQGLLVEDGVYLLNQAIVQCINKRLREMESRSENRDKVYNVVLTALESLKVCGNTKGCKMLMTI